LSKQGLNPNKQARAT